jgi:hypothetical protein
MKEILPDKGIIEKLKEKGKLGLLYSHQKVETLLRMYINLTNVY